MRPLRSPGLPLRPSDRFLLFLVLASALLTALAAGGALRVRQAAGGREGPSRLARLVGLTDLCLFSESRYTRHPSQADRHSAFQDHPASLEHFPSGSLVPPPRPEAGP